MKWRLPNPRKRQETPNKPLPGIPTCGQAAAPPPAQTSDLTLRAVAQYARSSIGRTYATATDTRFLQRYGGDPGWAPGPYSEWSGDCMRFAALTWYQIGVVPYKAGTAKAVGDYYAARGRMRAGVPPEGALAFYDWGGFGHVGTSVGNGQVVSTEGLDNARRPIRQHGYNSIGLRYRGWVDPR